MRTPIYIWLTIGVLLLTGCLNDSAGSREHSTLDYASTLPNGTISPPSALLETAITPDDGKITLRGTIFKNSQPVVYSYVWLARVYYGEDGRGFYALDAANSPNVYTNTDGTFAFNNIDKFDYVLVVGDPYGAYHIPANSDTSPVIYHPVEGTITDIGIVVIP